MTDKGNIMFQVLYQSVPAFMISCLKAASGKVLLWVMEQVSLAFRLLSFWLVLTDEKARSESPAASQQAWEGVSPQVYPLLASRRQQNTSYLAWAACQNFLFSLSDT